MIDTIKKMSLRLKSCSFLNIIAIFTIILRSQKVSVIEKDFDVWFTSDIILDYMQTL